MLAKLRARLTYANVMATIAVFIALGGASYAAVKIPKNSVGTRQIKTGGVQSSDIKAASVTARHLGPGSVGPTALQANSVGSDQIAPDAVKTSHVQNGSLQYSDFDANQVSPRLFAHVSSSGVLGDASPGVSASRESKGIYKVDFPQSLRGCVAVASVGFGFGPGVIGAGGTAQANLNADNQASRVKVTVYRKGFTFNDVEDNDVNLIVNC